jgi:tetratricopeptide (TPR) repeat protein
MKRRIPLAMALAACCALAALEASAAAAAQERRDPPRSEDRRGARRSVPDEDRRALTTEDAALVERANRYAQLGRCEEAIPILEQLVARQPRIAIAPELLSNCYLKTGRPGEAASLLERMLETDPDNFAYIRNLGLAYLDLGRREEAVAAWRRALKDGEQYGAIYGLVARLEQEAGLFDEAIATYRAGSAYRPYMEYYSNEIVRLERILGREENALRELLRVMGRREAAAEVDLRSAVAIHREAKNRGRFVALVDSAAAAAGDRTGAFRALKTAFLIEEGRSVEAEAGLFGAGAPEPTETDLHAILNHVARARGEERGTAGYDAFFAAVGRRFLDRHGDSALAPAVMLMLAENAREKAGRGGGRTNGAEPRQGAGAGDARATALDEALSLAAAARDHRHASPYLERAAALRARILFEDLHRGDEALAELDRIPRRAGARSLGTEELRMRALLASADRDAAARRLDELAADPDSNAARIGEYGLGALAFRKGAYGAAVKTLSELAEKHPASAWANDALEAAIEIRGGLQEGTGALDLYRAAVAAAERGRRGEAIDSLSALERRHPESALAPRAVFMRAEIEAGAARRSAARADFERVAEKFPAHELAPRALERIAALVEEEGAGAALEAYGVLMERYPDYPFMERVRERYAALARETGQAPGKGTK